MDTRLCDAAFALAQAGARLLVLTHFSQRYESGDDKRLAAEAAAPFGGEVVLARDLDRIPVPPRGPQRLD
jgi:ribonuclease Z